MIKTGRVYWNPDKILKVCQHPEHDHQCYVHLKDNEVADVAPCSAEDFSAAWYDFKYNRPMRENVPYAELIELATKAVGGGPPEQSDEEKDIIKRFINYWELLHEAIDGLMHKHQDIDYDTIVEQVRAVNLVRRDFGNPG